MKRHVICVLRRMLFIGVSVQIILGMAWGGANFAQLQEFEDTYLYFSGGGRPGLYALLVMITGGVKGYCILYLLQLALAGYAAYELIDVLTAAAKRKLSLPMEIWSVFGIITIPGAMQCHLAILPNSLTCSLFMLMIAWGGRGLLNSKAGVVKPAVVMGSLWVFQCLLMPEYRLVGGALFVGILGVLLLRSRKKQLVLLAAAFVGLAVCLSALIQSADSEVQRRESMALKAVSRFVWPNFLDNHGAWPIEVTSVMSPETAEILSRNADEVYRTFAPMMEQAVGAEHVDAVYWKLAKTVLSIRSREIAGKILWDGVCHTFSPYLLTKQLEGVGYQSYSGRNYEIMKAHTPGLTALYVAYEGWWFAVGIVLAALLSILTLRKGMNGAAAGKWILLAGALVQVIYYTMQGAGIMDYKQTVFVTVVWNLWVCSCVWFEDCEL